MDRPGYGAAPKRRSLIAAGWALGLALPLALATTAWLLMGEIDRQRELQSAVERTFESRQQLSYTFSLLLDAETGQRGFILTGDEVFLEPHERAQAALPSALDDLLALRRIEGRDTAPVEEMRRLANEKLSNADETIALRRADGAPAAMAAVSRGVGRAYMDQIRALNAKLDGEEAEALQDRLEAEHRQSDRVEWIVILLLAVMGVMLAVSLVVLFRALAAMRRALADEQAQSARLQAIFNASQDGMITLGEDGRVAGVNLAAQRMFASSDELLEGRSVADLLDLSVYGDGDFPARAQRAMAREEPVAETTGIRLDGSQFPVGVTLGAFEVEDELRFIAAVRDITRRKRLEQVKDSFIATVSHELRTPLTSISGSLDLLVSRAARDGLENQTRRLLEIAQSNAKRLIRLINDILDIEKLESGKVRMQITDVSLKTLAMTAMEANRAYGDQHGVRFRLNMLEPDIVVRGDFDRLMQVAANLLSNAVKFSPEGAVVELTVSRTDQEGEFTVRDYGPGVPEDFLPQLFGKFAQAEGARATGLGSTGLGLAIVREIAERLGGKVSYEPASEGGASFTLALPLSHVSMLSAECRPQAPEVLHLDDNADTLRLVAQAFAGRVRMRSVTSLAEAERALAECRPDAMIVDLDLGEHDALALLTRNASSPDPVPTVLFTALDVESAQKLGADRVFTKSRATLGELVDGVMGMVKREVILS